MVAEERYTGRWGETEVLEAANEMIRLHGSRARLQASLQATKALSLGEIAAFNRWNRIPGAIKDLELKS